MYCIGGPWHGQDVGDYSNGDRLCVPLFHASPFLLSAETYPEEETCDTFTYQKQRIGYGTALWDVWVAEDVPMDAVLLCVSRAMADRIRLPHAATEGSVMALACEYFAELGQEDSAEPEVPAPRAYNYVSVPEVEYAKDIDDEAPTIEEMWAKMEALGIARD